MSIRIFAVGKKHETWVKEGVDRYEVRLKRPFITDWMLFPHSMREGTEARDDESERLLAKITPEAFVILLDERGQSFDSPSFSQHLLQPLQSSRQVVIVIGGAYGVNDAMRKRANVVWSLSPLVFPHQLVRLMLVEQLYRAQEIAAGRSYHHV